MPAVLDFTAGRLSSETEALRGHRPGMTSSSEQPASGIPGGGQAPIGRPGGDLSYVPVGWLIFVMAWSVYGLASAWWLVGNSGLTKAVQGFSQLDLTGTAAGQGTVAASIANAIFTGTDNRISNAINQLRAISAALGTNVTILQTRSTFSSSYSNSLTSGANALTLADLNTEAANSQALQLRQQFGVQALVSANTQNQSVLTLLRG